MATRVVGSGAGTGGQNGAGFRGSGMDTGTTMAPFTGQNEDREKPGGTRSVLVDQVLRNDSDGRFVLIRARPGQSDVAEAREGDGEGEIWMLINTDPQARKTGGGGSRADSSRLADVRAGRTVAVKGGESMTWGLNLDLLSKQTVGQSTDGKVEEALMTKCKVAVLWEVVGGSGG